MSRVKNPPSPPQKKMGSTSPTHNNFYYPLPKGMKRNVEREKEEVLVRLIYKKT